MRTTVDLPDGLFRRAKACAASRGETLKTFLRRALENEVGGGTRVAEEARVKLPLIGHRGGPKIRLTNRDIARLEEEDDLYHFRKSLRRR